MQLLQVAKECTAASKAKLVVGVRGHGHGHGHEGFILATSSKGN